MIERRPSAIIEGASLLHLAEINHRVQNTLARAIAYASLIARNSGPATPQDALSKLIDLLASTAEIHRLLQPPATPGHYDLCERLAQLCRGYARSMEIENHQVEFSFSFDDEVWLGGERCWLAMLIVSELINNGIRHGLQNSPGRITVAVARLSGDVVCQVKNDTGSPPSFGAGLGSLLVEALAANLCGRIDREFDDCRATVTLTFPHVDGDSNVRDPEGEGRQGEFYGFANSLQPCVMIYGHRIDGAPNHDGHV